MASAQRSHMWTDASGVSLLELLTAIFVISVGLFGILQTYMHVLDNSQTMREHALAFEAVQQELEAWKAASFNELALGEHGFRTSGPAMERLVNASGVVNVTAPKGAPPDLVEVRVALRWRGEHGRTIEKDMTAWIARKN